MSKEQARIGYEFLNSSKNFLYDARETGKTHTPFRYEILLFNSIKMGDIDGVTAALDLYRSCGLVIGHMSDNPSRETHYWAVSTIAVAIHYAILGGLDESEAFQLSDVYIQKIDSLQTMETCIDYLCEKAIELAIKVRDAAIPQGYSPLVNACMHLIHVNLHSRLRIEDLARELHVSRDYLSRAFKKDTGTPLHQYILDQKLKEARQMLAFGMSINETSYTLCFCNESHFIQLFKKKYGVTPAAFAASSNIQFQSLYIPTASRFPSEAPPFCLPSLHPEFHPQL